MVEATAGFDGGVRVAQFYRVYLDSMYYIDYYRRMNTSVSDYAKHLDFIVALGAALGGGSGLGILASPWMAVPCSAITGASIVVSAAKQAYNWPEKSKFCSEMMHNYSLIYSQCKMLFEDLQASFQWSPNFEQSFQDLRKKIADFPVDQIPELSAAARKQIQAAIVEREQPQKWWKPAAAPGNGPPKTE